MYGYASGVQVEPRHEVNGRPTTKRDIKRWLAEGRRVGPSVSTLIDLQAKPGLAHWKEDKIIDVCWDMHAEISKDDDKIEEYFNDSGEYKKRVRDIASKRMSLAPIEGTAFHAALHDFINGRLGQDHRFFRLCEKAMFVLCEKLKQTGLDCFDSEYMFFRGAAYGFGGTIDLITKDRKHIVDVKTKQTALSGSNSQLVMDDHITQLAAYALGTSTEGAQCSNLYVSLETGECRLVTHSQVKIDKGRKVFLALLQLWDALI